MTAAVSSSNLALGSLVFDFEVDESSSSARPVQPSSQSREQLNSDKEKIAYLSSPSNICAAKLLRDVRYFLKEERDPDAILLATKLSAVGYSVNVRTALGGGTACFRNLRHEFLAVRFQGEHEGTELIVEPRFREHFLIPHPTEEFTELLAQAPDVFVGTGARLVPLVQILCAYMAASFASKALALPPWRRTQSMLSKWLPNRARDTSFSRASAPPCHADDPSAFPTFASDEGRSSQPYACAAGVQGAVEAPASHGSAAAQGFSRISDPLGLPCSRAGQLHQQKQQECAEGIQQRPGGGGGSGGSPNGPPLPGCAAATQRGRHTGDADGYGIMGFIPFGGAGGCSSDTEGSSPPSHGASTVNPAVKAGGGGPPRDQPAGLGSRQGPQHVVAVRPQPQTDAASPASSHRGRLSSLLAAHLQAPGAPAGAVQGQGQGQRQKVVADGARGVQTRPPVHWGEAPIHTVRLGFQVSQAAVGRRGGGRDSKCGGCQEDSPGGGSNPRPVAIIGEGAAEGQLGRQG